MILVHGAAGGYFKHQSGGRLPASVPESVAVPTTFGVDTLCLPASPVLLLCPALQGPSTHICPFNLPAVPHVIQKYCNALDMRKTEVEAL
jgi:hypothetical protein